MPELEEMTLADLKALAKEKNIKNISKLKKEELITILIQVIKEDNQKKEPKVQMQNQVQQIKPQLHMQQTQIEDKIQNQTQYDENGEPIVDYKLTNAGDEIVEGILDILPDGYGFLRGENYLSTPKDV